MSLSLSKRLVLWKDFKNVLRGTPLSWLIKKPKQKIPHMLLDSCCTLVLLYTKFLPFMFFLINVFMSLFVQGLPKESK